MLKKQSPFTALKYRDFRLLWLGLLISRIGSEMQLIGINWQIYTLTKSPEIPSDTWPRPIVCAAEWFLSNGFSCPSIKKVSPPRGLRLGLLTPGGTNRLCRYRRQRKIFDLVNLIDGIKSSVPDAFNS